ncbi:MAG: DUF4892 domain-containing protein [Bermanella sp.]
MVAKFLTVILLIMGVGQTWAIQPVNGSYQKHYATDRKVDHWLILGAIERIKGEVKPEAEIRVSAKVQSWLWQLPAGITSETAFDQIRGQVDADTVSLFECQGRSCGLSNDYANQVFQHSILYGRDSNQHYWLGLDKAKNDMLWLVYSIQRSNKRVYVYVERIDLNAKEKGVFDQYIEKGENKTLFETRYSVLSKLTGSAQLNISQIQKIKKLLQENPNKKFALVVHRYGPGENQSLLDQSQQESQELLGQLAATGGFIKNLYAHGAGAMLPRENMGDRIELVVLK